MVVGRTGQKEGQTHANKLRMWTPLLENHLDYLLEGSGDPVVQECTIGNVLHIREVHLYNSSTDSETLCLCEMVKD